MFTMGNNQNIIDSYVRGENTLGKNEDLESSLKKDKTLKSDFELTKLIAKSLGERAYIYDKMLEWESELMKNNPNKIKVSRFRKIFIIGGSIAASLIIGVLAIHILYNPSLQKVGDNYAFNIPTFDSSDYLSEDYLVYTRKIDSLINHSECEEALKIIALVESDFEKLHSERVNDIFEKAGIEETQKAKKIAKYLNDEYVLKWRKINVLLALDKKREALDLLTVFKDEDGIYQDDAKQLYYVISGNRNY